MKIIVCVKQVPDTSGVVAVKEDGTMDRAAMSTISNPDDMNALEAALQIKDANKDVKVLVLSMGPPPTESMLRECLAMGADEAYLVSSREFGGADSYAHSSTLAAAIRKIGVEKGDVVMCGRQAIDGDTAQVGPQIAEKLDLPQVTYVTGIDYSNGKLTIRRELEDGFMTIEVETPCVLTCIKELNEPRYMSVSGIMECYSKPYQVWDFNALSDDPTIKVELVGLKGSPTQVYKSFSPPVKGAGTMLEGADKATCEQLISILGDKHII